MTDLPPILRVQDLAPLLGISPTGVRALIRRGRIPASRIGRSLLLRRDAFLAALERDERSRRPAPAPEEKAARLLRGLPAPRRRHLPP